MIGLNISLNYAPGPSRSPIMAFKAEEEVKEQPERKERQSNVNLGDIELEGPALHAAQSMIDLRSLDHKPKVSKSNTPESEPANLENSEKWQLLSLIDFDEPSTIKISNLYKELNKLEKEFNTIRGGCLAFWSTIGDKVVSSSTGARWIPTICPQFTPALFLLDVCSLGFSLCGHFGTGDQSILVNNSVNETIRIKDILTNIFRDFGKQLIDDHVTATPRKVLNLIDKNLMPYVDIQGSNRELDKSAARKLKQTAQDCNAKMDQIKESLNRFKCLAKQSTAIAEPLEFAIKVILDISSEDNKLNSAQNEMTSFYTEQRKNQVINLSKKAKEKMDKGIFEKEKLEREKQINEYRAIFETQKNEMEMMRNQMLKMSQEIQLLQKPSTVKRMKKHAPQLKIPVTMNEQFTIPLLRVNVDKPESKRQ